ncbi:MAG: hypothetical protein KatS3mg044_0141 [Rhodothermaceae bacterium]|nr:MAG: hypothetical protein KatS3mg044_0141 [Rhodothermaceae bacterium]
MAILHPFRALRPVPEKAAEVACVPYDVIDTEEARKLAEGKPLSFLHVIRPEIDLPEGTDEHDDAVYEKGAENLWKYARSPYALQEAAPSVYVYRLIMDGRAQTGIFGCVSVADYDNDVILKHEKTRPDKEDDRTRHILTQRAHAEPVMLTFRDDEAVLRILEATQAQTPLYDLTADDGVRHTIWRVEDPQALVAAFERIDRLYVADGHHRCKAASRAAETLRQTEPNPPPEAEYFPAVLFPMGQMHIMAYNRIIKKLPVAPAEFLAQLRQRFDVTSGADPVPDQKGVVSIYLDGTWHRLVLPPTQRGTVADRLDVGRLSEHILEPMLGITNPRTDPNIGFVGGIRGTQELERLVDSGKAQMAVSMYPTSIEELVAVSDAGLLMPPKSTWFEPKLRSGLLVHLFEDL